MLKIVFFGTPDYVLPVLDALHKEYKIPREESGIVAVVTQPPRPTGRKKEMTFSPVDTWAHQKNIHIYFEAAKIVEEGVEADLGVLASYGEFIPKNVINHFKYGVINIHPSLLPKWRGSSPVQASILSGEKETGASVIRLDNELDHGPIISKFKEEIEASDTSESLRNKLFERSAQFLLDLLPNYISGKVKPQEQEHKKATFTIQIKKQDGFISPELLEASINGKTIKNDLEIKWIKDYSLAPNPANIERFIRAMQPWPGAWTMVKLNTKDEGLGPRRLKIISAHLDSTTQSLVLDLVQLEGKNAVSWEEFKKGYPEMEF
jgi:methionyl-tRNA formyltransferase